MAADLAAKTPAMEAPTRPRLRFAWPGGLRVRVSGGFAILLALALIFSSALIYRFFVLYQHVATDHELIEEVFDAEPFFRARARDQTVQAAARAYLAAWPEQDHEAMVVWFFGSAPFAGGQLGPEASVVATLQKPGPYMTNVVTSRGHARVLVSPIRVAGREIGRIAAVYFLDEERIALLRTLGVVILIGVLTFLVASVVAWTSTGRVLKPIDDMARTAEIIAYKGDLTQRIQGLGRRDELGRLAATFDRMLDRLEASFQRERQFISEASHELRTPITICRGHLEVLSSNPAPEELRETINLVVEELALMGRVVEDMTTLARVEDPAFLQRHPIALNQVMADLAARAEPLVHGRLSVGAVPKDAVIVVDPQRLAQALMNLVKNAVVHTPLDTPIELAVVQEREVWRFEVTDHGSGLMAGTEERLFQPFRRGKTTAQGSGLGLAIVRAIAEAHRGSAGVHNRPGRGATFWVRIPG